MTRLLIRRLVKTCIHPVRKVISRHLHLRHNLFDRRAGVQTTGSVTLTELGLDSKDSVRYEPTPIGFFRQVLAKLSINYPRTVFIDLGSGKGRALLLASDYPFRAIIGVEISPTLCYIARQNIAGYSSAKQKCRDITVTCDGICTYDFQYFDNLLIYMFNPCTEHVLNIALTKLSRLAEKGSFITIIYLNSAAIFPLESAPWLQIIRRGEAFDETSASFMPYVVFATLPRSTQWKAATAVMDFQFGPWTLGKWEFRCLLNNTNPLRQRRVELHNTLVAEPLVYQQLRDDGTISRTLSLEHKMIRYISYRGTRYYIDVSAGSFDDYLRKFSKKTRGNLRRQVRHFETYSGGQVDLRYYSSPDEMMKFRAHALAISSQSYQRALGYAFPESEEFKSNLIAAASTGCVCGFLLMHAGEPVSYAFCQIEDDIITYTTVGYDPKFREFSPGTVLFYLILERLFCEKRFRLFDFGGQAYDYKALFGTAGIAYARVFWFPVSAKNFTLVIAHHFLCQAWRSASWVKGCSLAAMSLVRCSSRSHVKLGKKTQLGARN